jgi:flagellar assembly factor FliW
VVITNTLLGQDFLIANKETKDLSVISDILNIPVQKAALSQHNFEVITVFNLHDTIYKLTLANYTAVVITNHQAGMQSVIYKQPLDYPTSRL